MSQENVEIVDRAHKAWQRDDLEGWLSLIDSDVENRAESALARCARKSQRDRALRLVRDAPTSSVAVVG
jgi:ketosteroid isomerase-like protein